MQFEPLENPSRRCRKGPVSASCGLTLRLLKDAPFLADRRLDSLDAGADAGLHGHGQRSWLPGRFLASPGARPGHGASRAGLVDHDQFTFTVFGEPFQDVNWLSQLIYFGLYQLGGLALVQVVNALFLAGTFALLIEVCRRRSGSLFWASLVGAGVFVGIWHVLTIRPQTFSLFLFVLLLDLLERAERGPGCCLCRRCCWPCGPTCTGPFPPGSC